MVIFIIGSGAREVAIAKALACSGSHPLLCAYGTSLNPALKALCQHYEVGDINDTQTLVNFACQCKVDFAIIGPEQPLAAGIVDSLQKVGIPSVGPTKALAQLETSKGFTRQLMENYKIAGLPKYRQFKSITGIKDYLQELGEDNYVIKADGLMAGKGVKVAGEHLLGFEQALEFCQLLLTQGHPIVIEEKLVGQEFSFMCFADGHHLIPMPLVQDHKRAYEGDRGPNTGGMGSYSDANHSLPFLTEREVNEAFTINQAVFRALMDTCHQRYKGILYGSFMATKNGIYVIEFNARFGDPEALNVLAILDSDLVIICQKMLAGTLTPADVKFKSQATVCKYAVPEGYPDNPLKNVAIDCTSLADPTHLYLAAVDEQNNQLLATGSRTAAYVGVAPSLEEAQMKAEHHIALVKGPLFHRKDIGTRALIKQRVDVMNQLRAQ